MAPHGSSYALSGQAKLDRSSRIAISAYDPKRLPRTRRKGTCSGARSSRQAAARGRVEALIVIDDVVTTQHRVEILNLAATHSLAVVSQYRAFAEAGALLAYGPDTSTMYRRAAYYVDRILKGADAGDLPVEQATKFDLAINLKTAKALGVTIPPSLLARADEVIE